jgi:hypothetical protein
LLAVHNGGLVTVADDSGEQGRLAEVYGRLRLKLLDLSKKNRMLNYNLGSRSKRHPQIKCGRISRSRRPPGTDFLDAETGRQKSTL